MKESYEILLNNNKRWALGKIQNDADYFKRMKISQTPEYLWIGCSDSRVPETEVTGTQQGQLFVHRNIANMVPNTDLSVMSVVNYAVSHLKVSHVVVCGHYSCGGVKAAMQPSDLGILNPWLRNIRDVYRIHRKELDSIKDEDLKYRRLVELNVQEQCINIIKTAEVQIASKERNLKVHGWIFDIHTGELVDMKINFDEILKNIMEIYRVI